MEVIIICILIILIINTIININSYSINSKKVLANYPKISILVPVRNEEKNIKDCLISLLNQNYSNYEILVLDDNSEDNSLNIIEQIAKKNQKIRYFRGEPLPQGWVGKNFACYQLAKKAEGEWLLFTDADTIHKKDCLVTMITEAINKKIDFLTLLPYKLTGSFIGYIFLPIINFFFVVLFPSFLLNSKIKFFSFAFGPFILIKRDVYWKIDGHRSVYDKIVEDVELSRKVKEYGGKLSILNGTNYLSVFYYNNFYELWSGFSKNFSGAIGNSLFIGFFLILFVSIVFLYPYFHILYNLYYSLSISSIMFNKFFLISLIWIGLIIFYKEKVYILILYPVCFIITFLILINSFYIFLNKKTILWKKRKYKEYKEYIKLNNYLYLFSKFFYYFLELILGFLIGKIFFQYKVIGKDNIKNINSRAIFIANHCHYLDCFLIGLSSFPKFLKFAAMSLHFENPILRVLLPLLGAFPIRIDGKIDTLSFDIIKETLLKNGHIAFFPECHLRHYSKKIGKFRPGAFMFADFFDAYIVPISVVIENLYILSIKIPFFKKAIIEFLKPRKLNIKQKVVNTGLTGEEKSFYEMKKKVTKEFLIELQKEIENTEKEIQESIIKNSNRSNFKPIEIVLPKKIY